MVQTLNQQDLDQEIEEQLRRLPSVDRLLKTEPAGELIEQYGRALTLEAVRSTVEESRAVVLRGEADAPVLDTLLEEIRNKLSVLTAPSLRPVINATGVVLHTNLGRAPLSEAALEAANRVSSGYSNLEYDLSSGARGSRTVHVEEVLKQLTGVEAALVVNNNAAAVLLMLTALCAEREVIISRGQLIEIGGGFRLPDVMDQSRARLVEVGTTNRTHLRDYARAINENTAALFVAHPSNFKIIGFTAEPNLEDLAQLAHENDIPLLYDQGSGALLDTSAYGLDSEPSVLGGLQAGADVVAFSGDKLLGGPQAGILCGRTNLLALIKSHPLARAVRADKLCLAALSATLAPYLTGRADVEIPVWMMIALPIEIIERKANDWAAQLEVMGIGARVLDSVSTIGGGSLPGTSLPTKVVAISHQPIERLSVNLRANDPPVIGRVKDGFFLLDPRTVLPSQETALIEAVSRCVVQEAEHSVGEKR